MTENRTDEIAAIFRAVFQLPADSNVHALQRDAYDPWDSLAHVRLILALESELELEIPMVTAMELRSLADVMAFVENPADS